jgi:hypothetical protein
MNVLCVFSTFHQPLLKLYLLGLGYLILDESDNELDLTNRDRQEFPTSIFLSG